MKNKSRIKQIAVLIIVVLLIAVLIIPPVLKKKKEIVNEPQPELIKAPEFNADSAYSFVKQQVDFGPRVTNTDGWRKCGDWIVQKLSAYADTVFVQKAEVITADNKKLNIENYIASFNPSHPKRIILCAHWDTRHISDHDANPENQKKPIPGADDGGSGVAVLIEIARVLHQNKIGVGIDLILFDAEDWGIPDMENSYCLGSQYWSRKPHTPNYRAIYAILLDMVGGKNSQFALEEFSRYYAEGVIRKVWSAASRGGYSSTFVYRETGAIADDHYYINTIANIPAIDIIANTLNTGGGFPSYWHTQDDDMDVIDPKTLKAVGQTVLAVIYNEQVKSNI